jgi:3-oxocholest-4-en-26-oate---CoA ligase
MAQQFHLADLFEIVSAALPERVALLSDVGALTYQELDTNSDRVAVGLTERGIKRGDTVGLCLMNGPEYIEAMLAIVKIGAVPFNVNYRYGEEELAYLFANAEASAIVHNAEFSPTMRSLRSRMPHIGSTIVVGGAADVENPASITYETLLQSQPRKGFTRSENDILLQYTGGTTGMPKGVMWPHKAFFFSCLGGAGHFHPAGPIVAPEDIANRAREGHLLTMFPIAPLMHGAAIWTAGAALMGGLTIVLDPMRHFDAEAIWDRVEKFQVNVVQIVGDAMAMPLHDALRNNPGRWNLDHVVSFGSGGAVFSANLKAAIKSFLPNATIMDGMGTSEGGLSGQALPSDDGVMRLRAGPEQWIIVDNRLAEPGETGVIGRSGLTPIGYYNDVAKTAEVFVSVDGKLWTISGDMGRLEDDSTITMFGRGSTCINTGGEKVFPEEVETALRQHPAIRDAVVVGAPDEKWGEAVTAIVSLKLDENPPTVADIRDFMRDEYAGYKCPKTLVVVEEVRRSPAGKQDYAWAKSLVNAQLVRADKD